MVFPDCILRVPERVCVSLNLVNGVTYELSVLSQSIVCDNTATMANSADVNRCCYVKHELEHACHVDPLNEVNAKCNEEAANNVQGECYVSAINYFCGEYGMWGESDCSDMCNDLYYTALSNTYDSCMCEKIQANGGTTPSASTGDCCDCVNTCLSSVCTVSATLPSVCITGGLVNINQDPCLSLDYHSCDYYGGPGTFNYDNDCTTTTTTTIPSTSTTFGGGSSSTIPT